MKIIDSLSIALRKLLETLQLAKWLKETIMIELYANYKRLTLDMKTQID